MKCFVASFFDNSAAAQNHGVSVVEQGDRALLLRCEILGCEVQSVDECGSGGRGVHTDGAGEWGTLFVKNTADSIYGKIMITRFIM